MDDMETAPDKFLFGTSHSGADRSLDKYRYMDSLAMTLQHASIGLHSCTLSTDWKEVTLILDDEVQLKVDVSQSTKCFDLLYEVVCAIKNRENAGSGNQNGSNTLE